MSVTFTEEQERAIDEIVSWYGKICVGGPAEFYLAGYAGTGKSTVCAEAIARIKRVNGHLSVPTAAFTGKAAHVLRKKGNPNAQTIHSLIYSPIEDPLTGEVTFGLNPLGQAGMADLIVLDECSMIDKQMADDLRSFDKPILVMGDPGQLPPISGEGSFTNRLPDVFLKSIHRQAAESPIIELATMARQGLALPIGYTKENVRVLPLTNANVEVLHDPNTQVICGVHRVRWAVTKLLRDRLGYIEQLPMPGEKILCCKNNKEKGLFNGGMGKLAKLEVIHDGGLKITGEVEGNFQKGLLTDPYLFRQHFDNGASKKDWKKKRNEFDFGYLLTCHKAQGSSWPHITIIDDSDSFRENKWLWLYTALTRAEEGLTILVK